MHSDQFGLGLAYGLLGPIEYRLDDVGPEAPKAEDLGRDVTINPLTELWVCVATNSNPSR